MKNRIFIVLVAFAFGLCLSVSAQDFNTGSDYMNSGSNYSSNVGSVGSTGVDAMYTTTTTRTVGARKMDIGEGSEVGEGDEGELKPPTPIGEPLVMLLFAAAAGVVVAIRRRKAV